MHLAEIIDAIDKAVSEGKRVVRLHTGDPSLYGATFEQMADLQKRDVLFAKEQYYHLLTRPPWDLNLHCRKYPRHLS